MNYTVSILQTAEQKKEGVMKLAEASDHVYLSFINVRNGDVATSEIRFGSIGKYVNNDIWIGVLVERGDDDYAGRKR